MMDVYWLEQTEADVPDDSSWLSAGELARLSGMRFPKRRTDWRLGRWTAKRGVAACLDFFTDLAALADIEIRAAPSGAPEVLMAGTPAPLRISLSHREGTAACAIGPHGAALGCDLEIVEWRSDAFIEDFLTAEEQRLVRASEPDCRNRLTALIWSAKESALKALECGLNADTRSVIVRIPELASDHGAAWRPLRVDHVDGASFEGWWWRTGCLIRTIAAAPPPEPPKLIVIP